MDKKGTDKTNVIDLFSRKPVADTQANAIIRLAPELDGMEMLYSNDSNPGKLYSMKVLCWALMNNGEVDALIPWLNKLVPARELNDPLNGHWEGYYDSTHDQAFFEPPDYKIKELESSATYYTPTSKDKNLIVQEITDTIGTHAVLTEDQFKSIVLVHVTSWRLCNDGRIHAMIIDEEAIQMTPVLAGDSCLVAAQEQKDFRYFFHHVIANKIKKGDPETMAAFTGLIDK